MLINHNGKCLNTNKLFINPSNRAFQYGDALFETIRVFDNQMPFLPLHYQRLVNGMNILKMDIPDSFNVFFLESEIKKIFDNNIQNYRVRLSVYRADGGRYMPQTNNIQYLIQAEPLTSNRFDGFSQNYKVALFKDVQLSTNILSPLKTTNSLPYILAALHCNTQKIDDCLLLNTHGHIVESISSNIFIVKGENIQTPPLSEGCIAGIMRQILLNNAHKLSINIQEKPILIQTLLKAEEVFLTNSIQGVRAITHFQNQIYTKNKILNLQNAINQLI